mgnify:CR=1 FL=1
MVYPEKLSLDQVTDKSSTTAASSWCSGPLERYTKIDINSDSTIRVKSANVQSDAREKNRSPSLENVAATT